MCGAYAKDYSDRPVAGVGLRAGERAPEPRVIGPAKFRVRIGEIWTTRDVAWMVGMRDIKAKYKQAALGPLWLVLSPLGLLAAVSIAFSGVSDVGTQGVPYVPFALTGLAVWTFIQLVLMVGSVAIVANAPLVRRSPMPRIALMTGTMISNLPSLGVLIVYTAITTAIFHHLTWKIVLLPVLLLWVLALTLGMLLVIGSISARFRDVAAALPLIIQAGIFVTPVGYGLHGAPQNIHTLLLFNPVSGIIEAWRWALVDMPNPTVAAMAISVAITLGLLAAGWRLFGRMEVGFADYV